MKLCPGLSNGKPGFLLLCRRFPQTAELQTYVFFSQRGAHAAPLASPQRRHKPLFVTGLSALYGVCSALTQCDEILRPLPSFLRKEELVFHHGLPPPGNFPRTPQQNALRFALRPGDCTAWHGRKCFLLQSPCGTFKCGCEAFAAGHTRLRMCPPIYQEINRHTPFFAGGTHRPPCIPPAAA